MVKAAQKKARKYYIGVDVGGTKIVAALVDHSGKILAQKKIETEQTKKSSVIGRQIVELIEDVLLEESVNRSDIAGIGLGIPGIVNPHTNQILVTPNIHLAGFPLANYLKKRFHVRIALDNDVNLGTKAEHWLGAGKNAKNLIGIFLGTGVGGGIILNGKIYTGSQGAAAELGHMIVDQHSKAVSAGIQGTLEALTSRRAIEREIREAIQKGKKSVFKELGHGRLKIIKSRAISKALRKKDPVTTDVVNNLCEVLAKTCISLRHIFNPDLIILGGGVIEACGDYILPKVRKIFAKDPLFKNIDRCQIVPSVLGDDAVILGAVALVKDK